MKDSPDLELEVEVDKDSKGPDLLVSEIRAARREEKQKGCRYG